MSLPYDQRLIDRSRALRKEMTPQERQLWYCFLKNYPVRFQRQKTIDRFIVDFYCHKAKLVIEIDGSQHYDPSEQKRDSERTKALERYELKVLRISNREINHRFNAVCEEIDRIVTERVQHP